ncbi:MAG: acetyl-CoA carboxylase biotin carboxyl carrier protein [Bacteroidota bacterium]
MKIKEIEGLIDFIAQSGLEEVNIETDQIKLAVKRNTPVVQQIAPEVASAAVPTIASSPSPRANDTLPDSQHIEVKAPMVGTFYRAPSQEAPPFVQVGDQVQKGQKLCIIEAMKLFNEIEADVSGTIVKVLVEGNSPVEYDQALFLIAPNELINK